MPAGQDDIKIDGARYIVTMDAERRIIADGSVAVRNGRITAVGKATELAGVAADRVIDGTGMVVTPGFRQWAYAHQLRPRRAGTVS